MKRSKRPTVVTIVGARPQFIKAAAVSRKLRRRLQELLVHTGQHYDHELSASFFEELQIPTPDVYLAVGSSSHGRMTGRMLEAIEEVLRQQNPDLVLVYGDTNSTLAGSLAAAKLGIPVAHVEAGLRSFDPGMPEEINRRLTDHVSALLLCPTPDAVGNLAREGIQRGVHLVGDVMKDLLLQYRPSIDHGRRFVFPAGPFYFATLHRQENVDDPARLRGLLAGLHGLSRPVIFPVHPRTRARMAENGISPGGNLRLYPPLPYLATLSLVKRARAVITDSGGLQKEAFLLRTPCVTLRRNTEWMETVRAGANRLSPQDPVSIRRAVETAVVAPRRWKTGGVYGRGRAAESIVRLLVGFLTAPR